MLMDLFHDTLEGLDPDIKCRRVHYYDFMQDVHRRMHEAKKHAPPRDVSRQVLKDFSHFFPVLSLNHLLYRWDSYQPFDPVPPVGDSIVEVEL